MKIIPPATGTMTMTVMTNMMKIFTQRMFLMKMVMKIMRIVLPTKPISERNLFSSNRRLGDCDDDEVDGYQYDAYSAILGEQVYEPL